MAKDAKAIVLALVQAIVETVQEEGWAPEGILFAAFSSRFPNMTAEAFGVLVTMAIATGKIKRAPGHVLERT